MPVHARTGSAGVSWPTVLATQADYAAGVPEGSAPQWVWQDVVHHEGASYIAVHFDRFELADGETAVIHDGKGGQRYELTGRGKLDAGTFWARHIKGDRLVINLYASGTPGGGGYAIDAYAAGHPVDVPAPVPSSICGLDDKQHAACYAGSHTSEYERARAVARLLINGTTWCTGFLVSSNNHFLTNFHCISNESDAVSTDYEFMAEAPTCTNANFAGAFPGIIYSGATLIRANPDLDYAMVRFTNADPAATYGYLELEDRDTDTGIVIYIPQHPLGHAKEIALFSTHPEDVGGRARLHTRVVTPCDPGTVNDLGYFADTEGGSSGSPVLSADSHKVVALHHCGGCLSLDESNTGIPINLIKDEISAEVESMAIRPRIDACARGPAGGPFDPGSHSYSISNNFDHVMGWTTECASAWISIHPASGELSPRGTDSLNVYINTNAHALGAGIHTGTVVFTCLSTGAFTERDLVLTVHATNAFARFVINDAAFGGQSVTLTPIPESPWYTACTSNSVTAYPVDATGSTAVPLGDDDTAKVGLTGGARVLFYGAAYTSLYINSNGSITFGEGDTGYIPSLDEHFALPRVSLWFTDLSPNAGGTVWRRQLADRMVITFHAVKEFGLDRYNSMQAELFTNGVIRLTWLDMESITGIIGLSQGLGIPPLFTESDLANCPPCATGYYDSDADGMADDWERMHGLTVGISDGNDDTDGDAASNFDEFVADTQPTNAASFFLGITGMTPSEVTELAVNPASTGRVYDIEWSSNLASGTWQPFGLSRTGTAGTLFIILTNEAPYRVLRTRVDLP